eukprot:1387039-Amorphochlora_amoeboformis.AAC.1
MEVREIEITAKRDLLRIGLEIKLLGRDVRHPSCRIPRDYARIHHPSSQQAVQGDEEDHSPEYC